LATNFLSVFLVRNLALHFFDASRSKHARDFRAARSINTSRTESSRRPCRSVRARHRSTHADHRRRQHSPLRCRGQKWQGQCGLPAPPGRHSGRWSGKLARRQGLGTLAIRHRARSDAGGASIHAATGCAVAVAFNAGNLGDFLLMWRYNEAACRRIVSRGAAAFPWLRMVISTSQPSRVSRRIRRSTDTSRNCPLSSRETSG